MTRPVAMKLAAFHLLRYFPIKADKFSIEPCSSESLLLVFAENEVESEVLIPITRQNNLHTHIRVEVTYDEDIAGLVWVRLLTMAGVPLTVQIGSKFIWDTRMPLMLN